jgi:hypothetical protein
MNTKVKIKKPPDILHDKEQVYRTIKCPLKSVLKNFNTIQPILDDTIKDVNQLIIYTYQFIRLYYLDKFNNNKQLPEFNKQFILDCMKIIGTSETNRGKQKNENKIKNKKEKDAIKLFYNNIFIKLVDEKISYSNKTFILEQMAKEMTTCIKTNISTHFLKHLYKYINIKFKKPKNDEIKKNKDKKQRKELYKQLNEDIRNLKSDIVERRIIDSKEEYHQWIKENINLLLPDKFTKSIPYDIKVNPSKYIKFSMYINKQIEDLEGKPYAFIPQRNNVIQKNVIFNTSSIADLLGSEIKDLFSHKKSDIILHCKKFQSHVWSKILKLEKRSIFENKNYVFYNQIMTDGFNCCLLFILKKYKDKEYGVKLPKIPDEDNEIIKLNDLTKEECNKYLDNTKYKYVGLDPGVNSIINMVDDKNVFYKYSGCRRRYENYTKRSNQIILKEKKKYNIIEKETELSKFNSKSLKIDEYKKFIINKNRINESLKPFYHKLLFRKLAFRRYVKTKQSEKVLLNEIENKYLIKEDKNKKLVIFHGNWSKGHTLKGTNSTPNKAFKKLLNKKFIVLETDEFKTSKLYNKNYKELRNVKVKKGKHSKYLHEVLTLKEDTEKRIYVNRDKNASMNILKLGKYYLENQERIKEFKRENKKNSNIKVINLTIKINKSTKKQITV